MVKKYEKQKEDLYDSKFNREDLIDIIIDARKQRDNYKKEVKMLKSQNKAMLYQFERIKLQAKCNLNDIRKTIMNMCEMKFEEK